MRHLTTTSACLAALLMTACGAQSGDGLEDPENSAFLGPDKSDSTWFTEEWSWEAEAVLRLVNEGDFDLLINVIGLSHSASYAIAYAPKPIVSLAKLDDLPYVGPLVFGKLRKYAIDFGYGPALAEEYPPAGEAAAIRDTVEGTRDMMSKRYAGQSSMLRGQHAKSHGCVQAKFRVAGDVPSELRQGLFEAQGTYDAVVRFSNGDSVIKADKDKDVRGMAIKVNGVIGFPVLGDEAPSGEQDFLLINHPTLMVRNVLTYADFLKRAASSNQFSILTFFLSLNPADWELRGLKVLLAMVAHKVASPLETRYWSTTPYALGQQQAVKYSARPCQAGSSTIPDNTPADYLRDALVRALNAGSGCFELMVQVQTDPRAMPIEDPTIEWTEARSPFVKVATIEIPPQSAFDSAAGRAQCEGLSFTPWHAIEEHRPLGGVNRARKAVYLEMQKMRRAWGR